MAAGAKGRVWLPREGKDAEQIMLPKSLAQYECQLNSLIREKEGSHEKQEKFNKRLES